MTIQPIKQDILTGELRRVATTVLGQPFTKLVGAQMSAISDGHLELYVDNREELSQQNGFIHGGVIGYLADNACAAVAGTLRPEVRWGPSRRNTRSTSCALPSATAPLSVPM